MKGADDAMTYEERIHQLQRFLREPVLYPIIERRAVYGIGSNAVLLYREFIRLSEAYPDFRFDGCAMGAAAHAQLSYNLQLAICAPADTQAGVLPKP